MSNIDIINATKEIVIAMISNGELKANEKSADEVAKCMDIVYKKLVSLVEENPRIIHGKSPSEN